MFMDHLNPPSPKQIKRHIGRLQSKLETKVSHLQRDLDALARGEAINLRVRLAKNADKIDRLRKEIDGFERALDGRVSFEVARRQVARECERAMLYEAYRERREGR